MNKNGFGLSVLGHLQINNKGAQSGL